MRNMARFYLKAIFFKYHGYDLENDLAAAFHVNKKENHGHFLDRYLPEACGYPVQIATNFTALPVSESQIILVWDKPLGFGFNYKITVQLGSGILQVIKGELGFGNAAALTINGLFPLTQYKFALSLECESNPGKYSRRIYEYAKTLARREFLSVFSIPFSIW